MVRPVYDRVIIRSKSENQFQFLIQHTKSLSMYKRKQKHFRSTTHHCSEDRSLDVKHYTVIPIRISSADYGLRHVNEILISFKRFYSRRTA